jgi:phosphomannomutase
MSNKTIKIDELMLKSGVRFGTSGARGLVTDMTDEVCYSYTVAFIQYLEEINQISESSTIAIGGDLRSSTNQIMKAISKAISDKGYKSENCGKIPTPAIAYYGLINRIPTIMVTGSHIPDNRNGIKFTKREGEILKNDELGIKRQKVVLSERLFDDNGTFLCDVDISAPIINAYNLYLQRYLNFFDKYCLKGMKIGVYQHSAVGRKLLVEILSELGAEVTPLGYSDKFIPVDTEAIRPEDIEIAERWASKYHFDSIVSTDGDSDRPLISDENGRWFRGDIVGILCAKYLKADTVATPVTSNSALEKSNLFQSIFRTKIGSPFVIEAMTSAKQNENQVVVGYEANGGFLIASDIRHGGKTLSPLPTRDAFIVIISILLLSVEKNRRISELSKELPQRFTYSDRLKNFSSEKSQSIISKFYKGDPIRDVEKVESYFSKYFGKVTSIDKTDGLRITFESDEIVHFRPSGNAPEFRCYSEAGTEYRAMQLTDTCIKIMSDWQKK